MKNNRQKYVHVVFGENENDFEIDSVYDDPEEAELRCQWLSSQKGAVLCYHVEMTRHYIDDDAPALR